MENEIKICSKCHIAKKFLEFEKDPRNSNGIGSICTSCRRNYYYENREAKKKITRDNYWKDPEKHKAWWRKYYQEHKEEIKKNAKEYRLKNKDRVAIWSRDYRNTPKGRAVSIYSNKKRKYKINQSKDQSAIEKIAFIRSRKSRCFWCGKKINGNNPKECHIEHIMPLNRGGSHSSGNIVASCPECNLKKKDKKPDDFIKELGEGYYGIDSNKNFRNIPKHTQLQLLS